MIYFSHGFVFVPTFNVIELQESFKSYFKLLVARAYLKNVLAKFMEKQSCFRTECALHTRIWMFPADNWTFEK